MLPPSDLLQSLAAHLGVTPSGPFELSFERDGRRFVVNVVGGKKPLVTVRASLRTERHGRGEAGPGDLLTERGRPKVLLRKETGLDRFGSRWRISREVSTGDDAFDAEVYIETDDPEAHVKAVLESAVVRHAVQELLGDGCTSVAIEGDSNAVVAVRRGMDATMFDPARLEAMIAQLTAIASALAPFDGSPRKRRMPVIVLPGLVFVAMLVALPFLFWADSSAPLVRTWDTIACHSAGALLTLPVLAVLFALVRGRASSLVVMLGTFPLIVLMGLMDGGAVLKVANARLDKSERQQHLVAVVSRRTETSEGTTTFLVAVRDWRDPGNQLEIGVGRAAYDRSVEGTKYKITTGAGRFGWEWRDGPAALVAP